MATRFHYKIRGTCATALSKVLLDAGQNVTEASSKIKERLGLKSGEGVHPDALIFENKFHTGLECRGKLAAIEKFQTILLPVLYSPFILRPVIAPGAILKAKTLETTSNDVSLDVGQDFPGSVLSENLKAQTGQVLLVTPAKPLLRPSKQYYFTTKLTIVGKRMNLLVNERMHNFSRILPEQRKQELLSMPFQLDDLSLPCALRFRSAAMHGTAAELLKELQELKDQFNQVLKMSDTASSGSILYPGEPTIYFFLTHLDKELLDSVRKTITPTIRGHHIWRGGSERLSNHVTLLEKIVAKNPDLEGLLIEAFREFLLEKIQEKRTINIIHWKPTGNYYHLGSAKVIEADSEKLVLHREVFTKGIYDGINVAKEPGDLIRTIIPVGGGNWWLKHEYYSQKGEPKGIYYNINTPVELDLNTIRYFDLIVDVVRCPNSYSEIIDVEELEELVELEIVSKKLQKRILSIAGELKVTAENHFFKKLEFS
ncbi:MAG: DUF402 domain-containing protein [Candidatus Odinarchaeota archaeon]